MDWTTQLETVGIVALAMALGGIIGLDRETAGKPAGLRTLMLVAGAAALLVSLGDAIVDRFGRDVEGGILRTDPIRIIEAVVTGVSFLGAGTIIRGPRGHHVEGLTTAAATLFVAGLGISVALRQIVLAAGATVLALAVLRVLARVSHRRT
jgi:putative Mg2+ transporter-C (MgtC) family protein